MMRWLTFVVLLPTAGLGAQGRTVRGFVSRADSHDPLPYSVVSIVGTSIERFSDDSGHFRIDDAPGGPVKLLVRHIGFVPRQIDVASDAPVRVELDRVAVALSAMRVTADRACGAAEGNDSLLTVIIDQIVENGRQYSLIERSYPFTMTIRQQFTYDTPEGKEDLTDHAVHITSDEPWTYKPGDVVTWQRNLGFAVRVPTISVFAQPSFQKLHCFHVEGVTTDSQPLLAVGLRASASITDPDIDGTIYLDPTTFVIRRADLRLSRMSRDIEQFDSVEVDSRFEELYPGVPFVTAIDGSSHFARPQKNRDGADRLGFHERQRILDLAFKRGEPGDTAKQARTGPARRRLDRIIGVYDVTTGSPIAGALVRDTLSKASSRTTQTGTASLAFVLDDHAVVEVSAPGYETQVIPTVLSLRRLSPLTIVLRPKP
jgi:hypothetical protein